MDHKLAAAGNSHSFEATTTNNADLTEVERRFVLPGIFGSNILVGNWRRWTELLQTENGWSE